MMNRLLQHFAAIAPPDTLPAVPQPEPPKGHSHFAVATFSPEAGWSPGHVDDAPPHLEYSAVTFQGRYHAVSAALAWVLGFNAPRLAECEITHERPTEWALLCFIDGTAEAIGLAHARNATPLRYFTHEIFVQPKWRAANLLDAPAADWSDEFLGLHQHQHATLDRAARAAIRANRKFRPGKRRDGFPPKWTVALAVEADPVHSCDAIHCVGTVGSLTVTELRRFHLVDDCWPISANVLAKAVSHDR